MNQKIQRFEDAVRVHENMGAHHPVDHPEIQRQYEEAKAALADGRLANERRAVKAVERKLYDLLGMGCGDGGTITEYANKIVTAVGKLL